MSRRWTHPYAAGDLLLGGGPDAGQGTCGLDHLMNGEDFIASSLPPVPSRVLEVGCGEGELARSLAGRGYAVTAIDPRAPDGPIFQQVTLEEFGDGGPFGAVVAITSLHHIEDLEEAVHKIHGLLCPGGVLILNEFGWERMDERTARWCASHITPSDVGSEPVPPTDFLEAWIAEHEELHDSVAMRRAVDAAFVRRSFEWTPYLAEHDLERPDLAAQELGLIQSGDINPLGFRYVGARV